MKYTFGQFELDRDHRLLTREGEAVPLSAKAFDLLAELVANHGDVVSKDELLTRVWPGQFVEENNLTVQMSALRKVFGGNGNFIATVSGKGYSFVAEVTMPGDEVVIEQRTIERITVEHNGVQTDEVRQLAGKSANRWSLIAAAVIAVLLIGGFFGYRYLANSRSPKITSVAVLPFINETADPNNEYLTDGLAESVTYSLSQMPGIRVMSRGSTFRYKGKETSANAIGSELNVQAILTGRVTQRGDTFNISSELVSTADNSVIWGEHFSRRMSDIEKLQGDIASSISDKLRFKLGERTAGTERAEAYQLYLKGLFYWNKRTENDLKQAVTMFQQAIEIDPSYAKAHAGLALTYNVIPGNLPLTHDEAAEWRFRAKAAAQKTLDIDPTSAEAHAVLADQERVDWQFAAAEIHFKRAIEINPSFAAAHQWYSEMLSRLGRHDEAIAQITEAFQLDPLSPAVKMNVALRYGNAGRTDESIELFKKLIQTDPSYPMAYGFLADIYAERNMYEEAFENWCKFDVLLKIDSPEKCEADNEELRAALKKDGERGFRQKLLEQGMRYYARGIWTEVDVAQDYARLGETNKAFEWLEKAYSKHEERLSELKIGDFDNIRSDPRYKDLLRRIGLPQ